MHSARYILTSALLLGTCAAQAQDRPPAMPTRDAQVRYQSEDPHNSGSVAWLAAEGRMRIQTEAQRGIMLVDTRGGGAVVVVEAEREFHDLGRVATVLAAPYQPAGPRQRLRREGTDRVAGQACTVWRIDPPAGEEDEVKRACITGDGVPLRLVVGEGSDAGTEYVATEVSYAAQDRARFRVPQGYRPLNLNAPPAQRR
jgi:hypothetical protein